MRGLESEAIKAGQVDPVNGGGRVLVPEGT